MRKKLDIEDYCRIEKKHQWKEYEEKSIWVSLSKSIEKN